MNTVHDIIKNNLCLGCGLCEALDKENCKMIINQNGFYEPIFKEKHRVDNKVITKICPGVSVHSQTKNKNQSIWGNVKIAANAWASDSEIRESSSSGGVTSALAIYLLETKKVDSVLHVGVEEGTYLYNRLYVSTTKEDILSRNASRYAPAAVFNDIVEFLEVEKKYAFIGKPCDIAAMQNFIRICPKYKHRVAYYLAIFCAGMPSYHATQKVLSTFHRGEEPLSLRYRGDGWPGYFKAIYTNGESNQMTYNDSWGKILGRELGFRCKICPDGIGLLADISSGDSWDTKDGYPDFTEGDGKNFCFVRTDEGQNLLEEASRLGYIDIEPLDIYKVNKIQRYQFDRRHFVGWRIAAVQLMTQGLLNYTGLGYLYAAMKANKIKAARELIGTIRRFRKLRKHG